MPTDPARIKELGQLGENLFKKWCITSRITSSRPDLDENGWDFFLEMAPNRLQAVYLDAQPSPIKALVQVKATDNFDDLALTIKVSNGEHLARSLIPTFMLIIDFNGNEDPKSVYLCHYDDERVGRVLKLMRELEAEGNTDLHKVQMTFRARPEERIEVQRKGQLLDELRRYTSEDLGAYVTRKDELLKTIGFEKGRHRFSLTTEIQISDLVNAAMGIGAIKVSSVTLSDIRFGIEMGKQTFSGGLVTISPPSVGQCRIIASSRKLGRRVQMQGEVFAPALPGLASEHRRVRIQAGPVQAVLGGGESTLQVDLQPALPLDIETLVAAAGLLRILTQTDVKLEFTKDGAPFATLDRMRIGPADPGIQALDERVRLLKRFIDNSDYDGVVQVAVNDLFDQKEAFDYMRLLEDGGKISMDADAPDPETRVVRSGVFSTPIAIRVGSDRLVGFCHWKAKVTLKGGKVAARVKKGEVWTLVAESRASDEEINRLDEEFGQLVEVLGHGTLLHRAIERRSGDP